MTDAIADFIHAVRDLDGALWTEMRSTTRSMRPSHVRALMNLNIPVPDLMAQYGIGVVNAVSDGKTWEPCEEGPAHVIVPVHDGGTLIDLCAFQPRHPHQWALRNGLGWALGSDELTRAISPWPGDEGLTLHASPLQWLAAGSGAVILQWVPEAVRALRLVKSIAVAEPSLAATVRAELTRQPKLPRIIMPAKQPARELEASVGRG